MLFYFSDSKRRRFVLAWPRRRVTPVSKSETRQSNETVWPRINGQLAGRQHRTRPFGFKNTRFYQGSEEVALSMRSSAKPKAKRNGRDGANVHPSDWMAAVEEIRLAVDFWVKSLAMISDSSAPKLRCQRVLLITQDPECVCACK